MSDDKAVHLDVIPHNKLTRIPWNSTFKTGCQRLVTHAYRPEALDILLNNIFVLKIKIPFQNHKRSG